MLQKRWFCETCQRQWIATPWQEAFSPPPPPGSESGLCPAPDCRSPHIYLLEYTAAFPGGDYVHAPDRHFSDPPPDPSVPALPDPVPASPPSLALSELADLVTGFE